MELIDIVAFLAIAGLGFLGFWRGFVRELIETIGALVAAIGSYRLYPTVSQWLNTGPESGLGSKILTFISIFIVIMIAIALLGYLIKRFLRAIHLGQVDRLFGFILGAVKGGLIVAVVAISWLWFMPDGASLLRNSKLVKADLLALDLVNNALPQPIRNKYEQIVGETLTFSGDNNILSANYRIPIQLIDSLAQAESSISTEAIQSLLKSIDFSFQQETLTGTIVQWDQNNFQGTIEYQYHDSMRTIGMFYGSLPNESLARTSLLNAEVGFSVAYSDLLHTMYAADVVLAAP